MYKCMRVHEWMLVCGWIRFGRRVTFRFSWLSSFRSLRLRFFSLQCKLKIFPPKWKRKKQQHRNVFMWDQQVHIILMLCTLAGYNRIYRLYWAVYATHDAMFWNSAQRQTVTLNALRSLALQQQRFHFNSAYWSRRVHLKWCQCDSAGIGHATTTMTTTAAAAMAKTTWEFFPLESRWSWLMTMVN